MRDDLSDSSDEVVQQSILHTRQVNRLPGNRDGRLAEANNEIICGEVRRPSRRRELASPDEGVDPRRQRSNAEGLDNIVVRSEIECPDLVPLIEARGNQE